MNKIDEILAAIESDLEGITFYEEKARIYRQMMALFRKHLTEAMPGILAEAYLEGYDDAMFESGNELWESSPTAFFNSRAIYLESTKVSSK